MAETPSVPAPPPTGSDPDYWCYQCEARVAVETLPDLPDLICNNCKSGFVESVPSRAVSVSPSDDQIDEDPTFGNQFIQVLRLIAEAARETDAPPPPPSEHADDDYLRVELDGWGNDDDDDDDDEDEEEHNELEVRNGDVGGENRRNRIQSEDEDDDEENDDDDDVDEVEDDEEDLRRRRRDVLRLRLRDFAARAANRRNRILDWAEILMGLEDHSIELRLQVPDMDGYIGNPGDYVDAAGYEALLQTLAESDSSGRRGAPPASKSAIEGLDTLVIKEEQDVIACAICKDVVNVGEKAKNLPCGHGYHDDCIVQWLGTRNSCPVCRFELATDDPEYEEERKKRGTCVTSRASSSSGEAAGAAAVDDSSPSFL
ncbi:E3 ubiquitin-protein ligase RING1 [Capsicum chinense]|uniref:RING-type E3 ubiquitin transferase n=1 Tax=Capsicum annuum TaxID=4072 RepID=A0A2G2Y018_CAPAN|nr:E3 ubiquitin-protein ligase CIP8 [Capsicum annuum]KAF3640833.1 E3 ubiquitin-protein ligase RING1 [Capsicum annuum]PHT63072.1 E3 ubiquitin-protein ligase RING1 [Capsicum annuum]PHT98724.1 E3 ubiquitin-protein ligase RING1 [Capsicum chinense]